MSGSGLWFSHFACAGEGWLPLVALDGMSGVLAAMAVAPDDVAPDDVDAHGAPRTQDAAAEWPANAGQREASRHRDVMGVAS